MDKAALLDAINNNIAIQILIQTGISIIVAVITLAGSLLIYGPKLRKEQLSDLKKEIGRRKADALMLFEELIQKVESFEVMTDDIAGSGEVILGINEVNDATFPSFMADEDSFFALVDEVQNLRSLEMYLDRQAGAYLLYLYKYLYELINYYRLVQNEIRLDQIGALIIIDVNAWARASDRIIIRDINKAKTNLKSHKDYKWRVVRTIVFNSLYNDSILRLLQCDESGITYKNKKKYVLLNKAYEELKANNYSDVQDRLDLKKSSQGKD